MYSSSILQIGFLPYKESINCRDVFPCEKNPSFFVEFFGTKNCIFVTEFVNLPAIQFYLRNKMSLSFQNELS